MERPLKRQRIMDPEIRSPRDPGSQLAEGLFTSEMGIRGDDSDKNRAVPSRTISLSDLQRREVVVEHRLARPPLQRRNAEHQLIPRAAVTVTSNVVQVNVGDGTKTTLATVIPAVSSDTVVSLTIGAVTVTKASGTPAVGSSGSGSQSPITTPPPTPLPSGSSSSSSGFISTTGSTSAPGNSTLPESSSDSTVTVTATSTLDFAYLNGTFVTTSFSGGATRSLTASDQPSLRTSTIGASGIGGSSDSSESTSTSYFGAGGTYPTDATATAPGAAASSSSVSSDGGGGGPGLSPTQQTVVGGVVGGVAGLAIILLLLLAFLRWYRRRLKSRGELPEPISHRGLGGPSHSHSMSQRSSGVPFASALAANMRKFRPMSAHTQGTTATASTIPESEKGFQRIAGRKIAPVLGTDGDGFGGSYGAFEKESGAPGPSHTRNGRSLAGSSFYRDSNGFYGGRSAPGSPTTASPSRPPIPGITRDFAGDHGPHPNPSQTSLPSSKPEGLAALRPSPARTPVTVSPAASSIRLPIQQGPSMDDAPPLPPGAAGMGLVVPMSRDGIGRSLASQDGSRVSSSRASGRSRFAEVM